MKKTSNLFTGVGLTILGVALLVGGGYLLQGRMELFDHSIEEEGTIVEIVSSRRNGSRYYHPVIEFVAIDGNTYVFTAASGTSSSFDFNQGDKLKVRYDVDNPEIVKIDGFLDLWSLPLALLLVGMVIFLSGAATVYNTMRVQVLDQD